MDLFDLDTYFSRIVPVKAVQNVMLRSAMAAVAANQIGQLWPIKPLVMDWPIYFP